MSKVSRQEIGAYMVAENVSFEKAVVHFAFKDAPDERPEMGYGGPVAITAVEDRSSMFPRRHWMSYVKGVQFTAYRGLRSGSPALARRVMFDKHGGYLDMSKVRAKIAEVSKEGYREIATNKRREERLRQNYQRRAQVVKKYGKDMTDVGISVGQEVGELLDDSGTPYALVGQVTITNVSEIALSRIIEIMSLDRRDQAGREVTI